MNDSREFQDAESICGGIFSHVPSHRAVMPSSVLCRAATNACDQKYRIHLDHKETVLLIHFLYSILRVEELFIL